MILALFLFIKQNVFGMSRLLNVRKFGQCQKSARLMFHRYAEVAKNLQKKQIVS